MNSKRVSPIVILALFLGAVLPDRARAATALDETVILGFPPVVIRHYEFPAGDGEEATLSFERTGLIFGAVFLNGELVARPSDFLSSTAFDVPVTLESGNDLVAILAGKKTLRSTSWWKRRRKPPWPPGLSPLPVVAP
ncbi:MAG: hypothetical protein AB1405_00515 [Bdellovibrionota bacterium]